MKLNRDDFNPHKLNIGSNLFQKKMAELFFFTEENVLYITTSREFKFKRLDDHSVSLENRILTHNEASTFAYRQIDILFHKNVEYISEKVITTKGHTYKITLTFKFLKDEDLWIRDNISILKKVPASKVVNYELNILGFYVHIGFNSNSTSNGKYIEKLNKQENLYEQLDYLLFLINEELLVVL